MLKIILALILTVLSFTTFANDFETIDRGAKNFNPKEQPILIKRKFIKAGEEEILVMTEDFGKLFVESNLNMDVSIQKMPPTDYRNEAFDIGFQMTRDILSTIYGIEEYEFQPGVMRFGSLNLAPEGYVFLIDVTFRRDGVLYNARLGRLNADPDDETGSNSLFFIYPRS